MAFRIFIDGKEYIGREAAFQDIFEDILKKFGDDKKVIRKIIVDKKNEITDFTKVYELNTEKIEIIDIITGTYRELCVVTIEEMLSYIVKLEKGYDSIVELVENEKISEAMTILNSAIEGIEWMNTAFGKILNIMSFELTEKEEEFLKVYSEHLTELVTGLESQDYVTVKDVILYDLKEDLGRWREILEKYLGEGQKIQ
ncbi:MAG: hypothetical protein M0R46_02470 [Candidatus Muirbacterium halophilum]|nr:hypothetical protein [Candidatus Muirbacterium halophilum]MCK9474755.1 hypothetical protein [Candidatus Muirbacterium halophilum]